MAIIPGYGGTVSLNFGAGATAFPAKNISVSMERASLDVSAIADFKESRAPGRYRRTATFDLMAQDGSADNAIRSAMVPTTLANAVSTSITLTWVNSSITYTISGFFTSAVRSDDPNQPGTWSITMEEF